MSGSRYFLDTNAIVKLLEGNSQLLRLLNGADYIATSVICELEFMSFPQLGKEDKLLFSKLAERIEIVDLVHTDTQLMSEIQTIRAEKKLKLPDAIIAASAKGQNCTLLTADQKILNVLGLGAQGYSF